MPIPQGKIKENRLSAKAYVYKNLKDWIIYGTLQPGEKIYDHEIAKYFEVSRTPVREAFQMLADQNLVEITPGKETRVAPLDYEETKKSYIILTELHCLALKFAWDKITKEDIEALRKANDRLKKAGEEDSLKDYRKADKNFHDIIVSKAGNTFLKKFTDVLNTQVMRVESLYFSEKDSYSESWKVHEAIISAMEGGSLDDACSAMNINWMSTLEFIPRQEA